MKILYCNFFLVGRSGTEIVTIETAQMLHRLGHDVCIYTGESGPSSSHLIESGIPVVTDLDRVPWQPDVVHSHHLPQSMEIAARFPAVPQIFICHDAKSWLSHPPALSVVRRWIAVDEICAERIERAIVPSPPVMRLLNAVDTDSYRRRQPLPAKARRALALVKYSAHIATIKSACRQAGLALDIFGPAVGDVVDDLPQRLAEYDLVFATARMALEAMTVGCSVIVADARGLAGIVTSKNVAEWRRHNFGYRLLTKDVTRSSLCREIEKYDSLDAARVSDFIRQDVSLSDYTERLLSIYEEAIVDFKAAPVDPSQTLREVFKSTLQFMDVTLSDVWPVTGSGPPSLAFDRLRCLVAQLRSRNFLIRLFLGAASRAWTRRIQNLKERFGAYH